MRPLAKLDAQRRPQPADVPRRPHLEVAEPDEDVAAPGETAWAGLDPSRGLLAGIALSTVFWVVVLLLIV